MTTSTEDPPGITDVRVAVEPPQLPSTLGQTPHEPTVRPWELELLISGALVFSMIQLPGQVDTWFHRLEPRLDATWFIAAFLAWYYVKLALYALVGGFVVHLAVRGYWVGVIGLEAVFPGGIRWDRTRSGPILRKLQQERTPALQTLIDRADRFASMVFGGALAVALMFFYSLTVGGVLTLATFALSQLVSGTPMSSVVTVEVTLAIFLGPMVVARTVDRLYGDRLDPDGRAAALIRRVGGAYQWIQNTALFSPLMLTLVTNLRQRRHGLTIGIVAAVFVAFFFVKDVLVADGEMSFDGYTFLPDDADVGRNGVQPRYYIDRRGDSRSDLEAPAIQTDIVRDPYVRLFIPYRPRRHNDLIKRLCPGVRPSPADDAASGGVIQCMARLQPVALNGRPVSTPFRFYTDPRSDIRGIVTYIPVAGLPRGENVITVSRLPVLDPSPGEKPLAPYTIPFWL
jgi:hypothetical protein